MVGLKCAAIVRSDITGLGTLSRSLAACLGFHRTLSLAFKDDRYDAAWFGTERNRIVPRGAQITPDDAAWLLDGADAVLTTETWYGAEITTLARRLGIRTALVPMHEQTPLGGIANGMTDLVLCPHELCLREAKITPAFRDARKMCLTLPIDTDAIPFRRRERARTFLHVAKPGERDGTPAVLAAWQHVKSDARLIVRYRGERPVVPNDDRITLKLSESPNYWDGYEEGDVLLHPHQYAGYSCPIHEALAAGLPVLATRFWPFCHADTMPRLVSRMEPELLNRYASDGTALLPPSSERLAVEPATMRKLVIGRPIVAFHVEPGAIAERVDAVYDSDIREASEEARQWSEDRSGEKLRGQWMEALSK